MAGDLELLHASMQCPDCAWAADAVDVDRDAVMATARARLDEHYAEAHPDGGWEG